MRLTPSITTLQRLHARPGAPLQPAERGLLLALLLGLLAAVFGPAMHLSPHFHQFADQRVLWGVPRGADVYSNLPFALLGLWGLVATRQRPGLTTVQRQLLTLFSLGLLATAAGSTWYHLQPDDARLVFDRLGMGVAFAGVLGLAAADRISPRAGQALAAFILIATPPAVMQPLWSGTMQAWAVLQVGGILLLAALAPRPPRPDALGWRIAPLVALYLLAKLCEVADHDLLTLSQGAISGHTLKHLLAAGAGWVVVGKPSHRTMHASNLARISR